MPYAAFHHASKRQRNKQTSCTRSSCSMLLFTANKQTEQTPKQTNNQTNNQQTKQKKHTNKQENKRTKTKERTNKAKQT